MTTIIFVHVLLSLVGILAGFVVIVGFLAARSYERWTAVFLTTTIATSVSGFLIPVDHITPAHVLGVLSLLALGAAVFGRRQKQLLGPWRAIYVVSAVAAQYLNVFVLVVQSFLKIPALRALAPTQTEPAFAATQGVVFLGFLAIGILATLRFQRPALFPSQAA